VLLGCVCLFGVQRGVSSNVSFCVIRRMQHRLASYHRCSYRNWHARFENAADLLTHPHQKKDRQRLSDEAETAQHAARQRGCNAKGECDAPRLHGRIPPCRCLATDSLTIAATWFIATVLVERRLRRTLSQIEHAVDCLNRRSLQDHCRWNNHLISSHE